MGVRARSHMKLEYLASGSAECPLMRLYDFLPQEAAELLGAVSGLAGGSQSSVAVHELSYMEPVGDCRLTFRVRSWDQAVVRVAPPCTFECGLTPGTWDKLAGLIQPFAEGAVGHQWLLGAPGEAALLLSVDNRW